MALEIFRLVGSIFVDNDEANKSIHKTDDNAQSVGQTLLKGVKTAGKWSAAIVAGASAAVGAMTKMATDSAAAMDEIDKGSQKVGLGVEAYQEWSYVMGQNGMDISKLEVGMKSLVAAMDGAASGTQSQIDKFDALGLSVTDANGNLKDQETMLSEVMHALAGMENGTEKARLATELFGKAGTEMMPMLNQGTEAMDDLTQRAHDLGLVVDQETVTAGVKLGDTMDDVKKSFGMVTTQLGAGLTPAIQSILDLILAHMPQINSLFSTLSPILTTTLDALLPPLVSLAEMLLPIVVELIQNLLPPIATLIQAVLPPILSLLQPILALLGPILQLLSPLIDLVVLLIQPTLDWLNKCLIPLANFMSGALSISLGMLKGELSGLVTFLSGVFTGDWKKAWEGVKQIFSSIWDGIKETFKIPINWIIDGINVFIRGLNKLKIPDWVPVVGGKGLSIAEIPKLAQGGVLERGQTGFLEGTGAEAVVPLENNRKWISAVAQDMQAAGIGSSERAESLLERIADTLEEIAGEGIYLDGNRLVGALAGPLDKRLGQIAVQKARAY